MGTKQIISKNISADSTQYIGKDGELWVDTVTNKMKISDGTTPGGVDLAGLVAVAVVLQLGQLLLTLIMLTDQEKLPLDETPAV